MNGSRRSQDGIKSPDAVLNAVHWDAQETRRWLVLQFTGLIAVYCSRCFIVVTIVPMAEELGWDERQCGIVLSAFFWGYMLTQIIGGNLSDRFGGDRIQWIAAVVWSLATLSSLYVAHGSIWPLVLSRFVTGLAQGMHFPALCSLISHKVPEHSQTKFYGTSNAGAHLGATSVGFLGSLVIRWYHWKALVVLTGCVCISWTICLRLFSASHHRKMQYRLSDGVQPAAASGLKLDVQPSSLMASCSSVPWKELLSHSSVIAYLLAFVAECSYLYIIPSWAPTFFDEVYPQRIGSAWLYNGAPPLVIAAGAYTGGLIINHLIVLKYDITSVRKMGCCICLLLPGTCLAIISALGRSDSTYPFTLILLLISSFCYGFCPSSVAVNCIDLAPSHTGSLFGVANTVGAIPGVFVVPLIGHILHTTDSWTLVFLLETTILFVGCLVYVSYGSAQRVPLSTLSDK